MSKKDDEKSKEQIIAESFARITEGMNEAERTAVFKGYKLGLAARTEDIPAIQEKFPNFGSVILTSLEIGMFDPNVQTLLENHRKIGNSAFWLQEQIALSLEMTIDIALGRTPPVSGPLDFTHPVQ